MGGCSLVQGAALGAAFDLLFISVVDATHKVARFGSDLNRLKSVLSLIKPAIDDVESFNKILDRPLHETEALTLRLIRAQKLINKCSKVKWNVFMRIYYANKLSNLETLLLSFFQISVAAFHFRETKRMSVVVNNLEMKMNEIMRIMVKRSEIDHKSSMNRVTESECSEVGVEKSGQGI